MSKLHQIISLMRDIAAQVENLEFSGGGGGGEGVRYYAGTGISITNHSGGGKDINVIVDIKDLTDSTGLMTTWSAKQDAISDLNSIRSGAAIGSALYDWAKASTKPSYSASEVGALPDNTTVGDTNVIETVKVNGTALTVTNKAVDVTVPSYSDATTSDSGLMSASDKTKLNGLSNDMDVETVANSVATKAISPNKLYIFESRTGNLAITLDSGSLTGIVKEYHFIISIGNTAPTITLPDTIDGVTWYDSLSSVSANKTYEFSILNGIGIYMEI